MTPLTASITARAAAPLKRLCMTLCLAALATLATTFGAAREAAASTPDALPAHAVTQHDAPTRTPAGWGVDAEVDPIAFAARGYSLHVGLWRGMWRLDLGVFGAQLPAWMHGNEGFTQTFGGFGLKLDRAFGDDGAGLRLGVEASLNRAIVTRDVTRRAAAMTQLSAGARVGYRWHLTRGWFVQPWVGVSYVLGDRAVVLDGARFESSALLVFPTVHVGYRF